MRAFLRVEPTGTIASFEQVGIPMATELVRGIVFYPPLPHGKSRRLSIPHAYACLYRAPTGTRTQNTRILSPLSLPIGL